MQRDRMCRFFQLHVDRGAAAEVILLEIRRKPQRVVIGNDRAGQPLSKGGRCQHPDNRECQAGPQKDDAHSAHDREFDLHV